MGENWETLGNGVWLLTDQAHRFGEDALLLADFARPRSGERCCDLGTGCGIVAFQWRAQGAYNPIDGVELDGGAVELAKRSAAALQAGGRITFHHADWNRLEGVLPAGAYGLAACNPPYFPPGSGGVSRDEAAAAARHEPEPGLLPHLAAAAARLLKNGGRFCLCHRPERLCDVLEALRASGLEPKRLQLVQHRREASPWLLLCEARKGGRPGLRVLPPLVSKSENSLTGSHFTATTG